MRCVSSCLARLAAFTTGAAGRLAVSLHRLALRRRPSSLACLGSVFAALLIASVARADGGALSVDGAGGLTGLLVPAPYAQRPSSTAGAAPSFSLGVRYALSNDFEVTLAGFYELPVTYFHNNVVTVTPNGAFAGTLSHTLTRFGASAGLRFVHGAVFRLVGGVEAGWSHRHYAAFSALNDANPDAIVDYGLSLPSYGVDNLTLAATVGLEWAGGDHWSISFLPRAFALVGREPTFGFVLPLSATWSWYL